MAPLANLDDYLAPANPLADGMASVDASKTDERKMLVYAVICTDAVDLAGDIVVPSGCLTYIHQQNPVVLYHHGLGMGDNASPGYIFPVAQSADENGNYGVIVRENEVTAWSKFTEKNSMSYDVFTLIAEGILRGFSVNATPIPGTWERITDKQLPDGRSKKCWRYGQWAMREYSVTPSPVNYEATRISIMKAGRLDDSIITPFLDRDKLTVAIQKGKIGCEKFHKVLQSDLSQFMLTPKVQSRGVTIRKAGNMDYEEELDDTDDESRDKPNPSGREVEPESDSETDENGIGKEVDADDSEVSKGDSEVMEDGDLKPTPRAYLDGRQMHHDYWGMLCDLENTIEDPEGMQGLADIHLLMEQIDQIYTDTLGLKGVKGVDKTCTYDQMKTTRKAAKKTVDPVEDEGIMKGCTIRYKPIRLGILRAGQVSNPTHKPSKEELEELAELKRTLAYARRRLERRENRTQLTNRG